MVFDPTAPPPIDWSHGSSSGEYICPHCRNNTFVFRYVAPHVGVYCHKCGKWLTWLPVKKMKGMAGTLL